MDLNDDLEAVAVALDRCAGDHADLRAAVERTATAERLDKALTELGLPALLLPQQEGGLGLGLVGLCLAAEALGRHALTSQSIHNCLAAFALARAGSKDQQGRWLAPLLRGEANAALIGEDPHVEMAATPDIVIRREGADLWLLEECSFEPVEGLDLTRRLGTLREAGRSEALPEGGAWAGKLRDGQLILLAADAAGAGGRAHEMTVEHALQRRQFGRPIGAFQAVKHQLADMAVDIAPCRYMVWRAASLWDDGAPGAERAAALTKAHVTEAAVKVSRAAVRAHGGIGYTWEYPLHLFLKRAMHDAASLGSPAGHRARAAQLAGW